MEASSRESLMRLAKAAAAGVSPCRQTDSNRTGMQRPADGLRVRNDRVRAFPGDEGPVVLIAAIRKEFLRHRQTFGVCGLRHGASCGAEQIESRGVRSDCACNGSGQRLIAYGGVVERPVGLDVGNPGPLRAAYAIQRADLKKEPVDYFLGRQFHIPPAEASPVRITGMSADAHAVPAGERSCAAHDAGVAGMAAAGDIRRGNQREELRIGAVCIGAKSFPEVRVEINRELCVHRTTTLPMCAAL